MSYAAPEPKANMGEPIPRVDARLKVTGAARYPADVPVSNPAFAYFVTSGIARGEVTGFDLTKARTAPGVLDILTHETMHGAIKEVPFVMKGGPASTSIRPLDGPHVWHDGQIVAVVLADTFEAARDAAYRIKVSYAAEKPAASLDAQGVTVQPGSEAKQSHEDPAVGNAEGALASAPAAIDAWYETPTQHHNPMELFSTTCVWSGRQLTVYEPSQNVYGMRFGVAEQLGIDPQDVRVVSTFVGGAFGSKGSLTPRTAIIAVAARRLNRPVKLVATRAQGFTIATYRAETRHHVRLGAGQDGKLVAYSHEGWEVTSRPDGYLVGGTDTTVRMYACPNVATKVWAVHADRNTPGFMRSPPEVPYMFALESGMDELAVKLGMDPVELRRVNDTMKEPIKGVPFSSRSLMPCFDQAAAAFGWSKRDPKPMSMRDGDWLIGWGCAMTCYPTQMAPAAARVRLTSQGDVRVETASHDLGTGAYTVIAQTAARQLGVDVARVTVELGDSSLPPAPVSGGSITTASVCSAVAMACDQVRGRLASAVTKAGKGPLAGHDPASLTLADGQIRADGAAAQPITKAFDEVGAGAIEEYAEFVPHGSKPGAMGKLYGGSSKIVGGSKLDDWMMYAFGAEFVEVRVNARTREIRAPRIVGAFAAGHIVNPRTTHSQLMGGLIWGISSALHEETEIDKDAARYVNDNLAEYLIPVNADIQKVEVILVPEEDKVVNPLGIKGLGELANVGTNAAVANAVYHATGIRVRKLPIRMESLLV